MEAKHSDSFKMLFSTFFFMEIFLAFSFHSELQCWNFQWEEIYENKNGHKMTDQGFIYPVSCLQYWL